MAEAYDRLQRRPNCVGQPPERWCCSVQPVGEADGGRGVCASTVIEFARRGLPRALDVQAVDLANKTLNHPVPPELLVHIGDMTVSFALLELQMQSFMGSLIREHQRVGQILSSYLAFSNLRAAIISLFLERHGQGEDFSRLKAIIAEAGKLEEERNRITHSVWAAGETSKSITRLKFTARESRGFQAVSEQYDADRLSAFAAEVRTLAWTLLQFQVELVNRGKLVNNPIARSW